MSKKIIASLTSYGKRVSTVHLAIQTILNQTKKADKVILWLAENEFNLNNIPNSLKNSQDLGLDICFCKDIKSYKKLIPTLKQYPNDIIITFDDDAYYKKDVIEKLYTSYIEYPKSIHCLRGHKIIFDKNMAPISYDKWELLTQDFTPNYDIFPTGLGGILYPPKCFYKDILNEKLFMKLTPTGDDIWFKMMTLLNGYTSRVVKQENNFYSKVTSIENTQDTALWNENKNIETGNNLQIKEIYSHYNNLLKFNSYNYWNKRYEEGGNSGAGSYNRLAQFKANTLNDFININKISNLIEFGSGDGNNLSLYSIDNYTGIDISHKAIELCQTKFHLDNSKTFLHISELSTINNKHQLSISFDVIYHLIEDDVYNKYMENLFNFADEYVIIYSSNKEERFTSHIRHHEFTKWVMQKQPNWDLIQKIDNCYPYDLDDPTETSFADFYIYKRKSYE